MQAKLKNEQNSKAGHWLEITAGIACFVGVIGVIALLARGSWAADNLPVAAPNANPRGGFQPGAKTFNNPFANSVAGAQNKANVFDDEDDSADYQDDRAPNGAGQTQVQSATQALAANAAAAKNSLNAPPGGAAGGSSVSFGGSSANGGVIQGKPQIFEKIDDETGAGSKEVVTDFNFPDADIVDIAKTLGKLTGKNFIFDKDVKGRITIVSNSPITVGDAWRAFLTALDVNQFSLIPSGKYIRISRQRDARDKQLKTYTGESSPDTDALITRVFQLKYINSEEVARTFRSFMPANSRIIPYEQTNTVIVTDTGSNIAKLSKMLEILDIEGFDAGIEVIPVKYASAAELAKLIDQLIPGTGAAAGGATANRFGGGGFGAAGGSHFSARRTKEGGIINTIMADERTNNLIVHANGKGADQVRELLVKLDQKVPAQTGGGKVHVVYLQFADAEAISTTLNNLSSQAGGAAPGGFKPAGGGTGNNPVAASLFEGAIKVSPDKATNSLVVTATPADFVTVQRVINRLDIPRDEIYVEVIIMEINLQHNFDYSSNIINPSSGLGLITSATDLQNFFTNPVAAGAILSFPGGKSSAITMNGQTYNVSSVLGLIHALQTNTDTNILATPQVIALDNTEATFESAEKIPVPTTTVVQGGAVSNSVSKESVSLSIKIKPQINKISNFVKLDIEAKLADISNRLPPKSLQDSSFATIERNAKTTVVVADADTVVLGGLVRDKITDTVQKIPLLGDIPILGWLFKSKSTSTEKSNLLIFMTPHIVRQYDKVRAILDRKLKERDDFIESNVGGVDGMRETRDSIIRSLPDLKDIAGRPAGSSVTIDDEKPAAVPVQEGNPFTGGKTETRPADQNESLGNITGPKNGITVPQANPENNTSLAPPNGDFNNNPPPFTPPAQDLPPAPPPVTNEGAPNP